METSKHKEHENGTDSNIWPPSPIGLTNDGTSMRPIHILTKYSWLDIVIGAVAGIATPPIFAILSLFMSDNVNWALYSGIILPLVYLVSACIGIVTALVLRRHYHLLGTSLLVGTGCSLLPFGLLIWVLFNMPRPPS